jgi:hypothetical protein
MVDRKDRLIWSYLFGSRLNKFRPAVGQKVSAFTDSLALFTE